MSANELITLITEARERLAKMESMVAKLAKKEMKKAAKKASKEASDASDSEIPYPPMPSSMAKDSESEKSEKPEKAEKPEKPEKAKRTPSAWATALKEVYTPLVKEALGEGVKMNGIHMKVAGYLKKNGNENPSLDDVKDAIEFLMSNPDYKSDTAQKRSDTASESSKKRGRPKKTKVTE